MSETRDSYGPDLFGPTCGAPYAPPVVISGKPPPQLDRTGHRTIFLSASNVRGGAVTLCFSPARGGFHVWRSLAPQRFALRHVTTFPGKLTVHSLVRLLAAGAIRPAVDAAILADVEAEGVCDRDAALLRLAWSRTDGKLDPRVAAVVRLRKEDLDEVEKRMGGLDIDGLLELGGYLVANDAAWFARWHAEVDAEVDRRAAVEGVGEEHRRALRAFVEECLLMLGRLPRPDETAVAWDGVGLRDAKTRPERRRTLRLTQVGRVRRYRVKVHFWTGVDTYGYSDFGPGPGWYWVVQNPNPDWRFCDPSGPYKTPEEAWSDASYLGQED